MQSTRLNPVFNYSHTIGSQSPGGPGFRYPVHLALSKDGLLYVVNRGHDGEESHRVSVLKADSEYIGQFGSNGTGDGQFVWPVAVAVDKQGLVYVVDEWLNRISIYDGNLDFGGRNLEQDNFLGKWGCSGVREGEIAAPASLAFDHQDHLYITEGENHRVSKFTKSGRFIMAFGYKGSGPGQFNRPWGVTIDPWGSVYVADWGNDRVQKFTSEGKYLAEFGVSGESYGELHMPSGVAVDSDGDVYVADWWNNKVEIYHGDGAHFATLIGDAKEMSRWGKSYLENNIADQENRALVRDFEPEFRFLMPTSIVVGSEGHVFVADSIRFRIQVYQKMRRAIE